MDGRGSKRWEQQLTWLWVDGSQYDMEDHDWGRNCNSPWHAFLGITAAGDKDVDHVHDDVCDLTDHSSYERELFSIRRVVGLARIELVIFEILETTRDNWGNSSWINRIPKDLAYVGGVDEDVPWKQSGDTEEQKYAVDDEEPLANKFKMRWHGKETRCDGWSKRRRWPLLLVFDFGRFDLRLLQKQLGLDGLLGSGHWPVSAAGSCGCWFGRRRVGRWSEQRFAVSFVVITSGRCLVDVLPGRHLVSPILVAELFVSMSSRNKAASFIQLRFISFPPSPNSVEKSAFQTQKLCASQETGWGRFLSSQLQLLTVTPRFAVWQAQSSYWSNPMQLLHIRSWFLQIMPT